MLKNIFHALLIVLIAGLIAGGWYAFSLTPASQNLLPERGETRPAVTSTAQTDASVSTTAASPAAPPANDTEAGIFSARIWSGILKHAVLLAVVTVAVLAVRKVITLVKDWRRSRAAKLTTVSTGRSPNWPERREFLRLGGMVLAGGALAMVYKNITGSSYAAASKADVNVNTPTKISDLTSTPQSPCMACPKRRINDPYPGKCDLYVDNDNDGLCDYSVATAACATLSTENSTPAENNNLNNNNAENNTPNNDNANIPPSEEVTPGSSSTPQPQRCVACRKGLTNDPYPGQCHSYIDNDNDGFCDYSVATADCNSISGENRTYTENYGAPGHLDSGWLGHNNGWQGHGHGNRGH